MQASKDSAAADASDPAAVEVSEQANAQRAIERLEHLDNKDTSARSKLRIDLHRLLAQHRKFNPFGKPSFARLSRLLQEKRDDEALVSHPRIDPGVQFIVHCCKATKKEIEKTTSKAATPATDLGVPVSEVKSEVPIASTVPPRRSVYIAILESALKQLKTVIKSKDVTILSMARLMVKIERAKVCADAMGHEFKSVEEQAAKKFTLLLKKAANDSASHKLVGALQVCRPLAVSNSKLFDRILHRLNCHPPENPQLQVLLAQTLADVGVKPPETLGAVPRFRPLFRCLWKKDRKTYEESVFAKLREYCLLPRRIDSYFRMLEDDKDNRPSVPALDALIHFVGTSSEKKGLQPTKNFQAALIQYYATLDATKLPNVKRITAQFGSSYASRREIIGKMYDMYGVAPAFSETEERPSKSLMPRQTIPRSPETRAQWWFDIVVKQVSDLFTLSLMSTPPMLRIGSRISFLRSDLAASYNLYQFPNMDRRLVSVSTGKDDAINSGKPNVDEFFKQVLKKLFTHSDLQPAHILQAHDHIVSTIEQRVRRHVRHPWFCAQRSSSDSRVRRERRDGQRAPMARTGSSSLATPVPVTKMEQQHQKDVLSAVQKADKLGFFADHKAFPTQQSLRADFDEEFPVSAHPERLLDYPALASKIENKGYDQCPGLCFLALYDDLEAMCWTALRFYGRRLFCNAGQTPAPEKGDDIEAVLPVIENLEAIICAVNIEKVKEPSSRSKLGKSAFFNLLPGPPTTFKSRGARKLWNFVRTLRSCDPKGPFQLRPPDKLFTDDESRRAYPQCFDALETDVQSMVASGVAIEPETAMDDLASKAVDMLHKYVSWVTPRGADDANAAWMAEYATSVLLRLNDELWKLSRRRPQQLQVPVAPPVPDASTAGTVAAVATDRAAADSAATATDSSTVAATSLVSGSSEDAATSTRKSLTVETVVEELRTRCTQAHQKFFFSPFSASTFFADKIRGEEYLTSFHKMFPAAHNFKNILNRARDKKYLANREGFQRDAKSVFDHHIQFCEKNPGFELCKQSRRTALRLKVVLLELCKQLPEDTDDDKDEAREKLHAAMQKLLEKARRLDHRSLYEHPVAYTDFKNASDAQEYFDIVPTPKSFSEVDKKLNAGYYDDNIAEFLIDIRLPFLNAKGFFKHSTQNDEQRLAEAVKQHKTLGRHAADFCRKNSLSINTQEMCTEASQAIFDNALKRQTSASASKLKSASPKKAPRKLTLKIGFKSRKKKDPAAKKMSCAQSAMRELLVQVMSLDPTFMYSFPVTQSAFNDNNIPEQGFEYFRLVQKPMCFSLLELNLDLGNYDNDVQLFLHDLSLPFRNASEFFGQSKHGDRFALRKTVQQPLRAMQKSVAKWCKKQGITPDPPMPVLRSLQESNKFVVSAETKARREKMWSYLQKLRDLDTNKYYESLVVKSKFPNPLQGQEYFDIIKKPMAFSLVDQQISLGKYDGEGGLALFLEDASLPFSNGFKFYSTSRSVVVCICAHFVLHASYALFRCQQIWG